MTVYMSVGDFCSFQIADMDYAGESGMFLVNLNISVCLESGQPCGTVIPVFVNSLLPKEVCQRGQDFINNGMLVLIDTQNTNEQEGLRCTPADHGYM